MVFQPGADNYTIGPDLRRVFSFSGAGLINNSGIIQHIRVANSSAVYFVNSADAGSKVQVLVPGTINTTIDGLSGFLDFKDSASAGSATLICQGGLTNNGSGGVIHFYGDATAANSTMILEGGIVPGARGAQLWMLNNASLGKAKVTLYGVATVSQGPFIAAFNATTGDGAQLTLTGNSNLDITSHDQPGFTLGSLSGEGGVYLGGFGLAGRTLTVGNSHNTTFSGFFEDQGSTGSLSKDGSGSLTLTGASNYLGTTLVKRGKLIVNNSSGSGTGSGPLQVDTGTLGGTGTIAGPVTVGRGSTRGAFLAPGADPAGVGTLALQSSVSLLADGTFQFDVSSNGAIADRLVANGVTIDSSAKFLGNDIGTSLLPIGTVFVAIDNVSANPVSGTFGNLPDAATIVIGNNHFQANYEGGDGNDLTLTVVP